MLHVIGLPFNPFQENTWLLHNGDQALVIDPGCWNREEEHVLEEELTRNKLRLVRCLLTHAHIDHVLGLAWVHRRFRLAPEPALTFPCSMRHPCKGRCTASLAKPLLLPRLSCRKGTLSRWDGMN